MYDDLRYFATFIGSTRGGHSLVGALLDAHANVTLPHEVDVFRKGDAGSYDGTLRFATRSELLDTLVRRSREQADEGRAGYRLRDDGTRYRVSYSVQGQFQGRVTEFLVAGNKRGQATAKAVRVDPGCLDRLQEQVGVPVKLLHVIRNPFDNIASMTHVHHGRSIIRYFDRADGVRVAESMGWEVLHVHIEQFIARPQAELTRVCGHFDLGVDDAYLEACSAVVMKEPNQSRSGRSWTEGEIREVRTRMAEFDWFSPYADTEMRP